ncbi:MAG: metallophosphoesterase [Oscillospiraceae bacterium]|nr:metallophosphoesterase [Oscillospiraceae bacterium]
MIRIFLTGDNHIGLKYTKYEKSGELVQARLDALKRAVTAANEEKCHILAVAGDLFDSVRASKKDIKAVCAVFSEFEGTVAVLPGNHDYYTDNSELWSAFRVHSAPNTLLMTEYHGYPLQADGESVELYPAFCDSRHSETNRLSEIRQHISNDENIYRIGMAHGAIEGLSQDNGKYFLMTERELSDIPVDVWLIGHTHIEYPRGLSDSEYKRGYKIFNAGTHAQTDVSNNSEGVCFILELEKTDIGCDVRAKRYVSGEYRFVRTELKLSPDKDMTTALTDAMSAYHDNTVIEVSLSGSVSAEDYSDRTDIYKKVFSRFTEYSVQDRELSRQLTEDIIRAEFAETSLPARLLTELLSDPKEAQLAYELLTELTGREGKK